MTQNKVLVPTVKLGDTVLRRDRNGGELDTWHETVVNETYLKLIQEFPEDYRNTDGSELQMAVQS